jgi:hypothetical protein
MIQDEAILCRFCGNKIPSTIPQQAISRPSEQAIKPKGDNFAAILYIVASVIGTLYALWIVSLEWGFIGAVIAFFVFPVAIAVAPVYAIVVYGAWWPAILIYGLYALGIAVGVKES